MSEYEPHEPGPEPWWVTAANDPRHPGHEDARAAAREAALVMTVAAADVADALDFAWRVFRQAGCDDAEGRDMAAVPAEVRPAAGT